MVDRSEIGRKGGEAVSKDRQHMAEIGRKGGLAVSRNRQHMSEIGRKGGESSHGRREDEGFVERTRREVGEFFG